MVMTDIEGLKVPRMPLIESEQVVAVGHAGHVHLLDIKTGQVLWTRALAAEPGASACEGQPVTISIADGIVVAAAMGHVFAIRRDDGIVMWHTEQRARGAGETSLAVSAPTADYVARLES
jgi:outer membrane protein assembly factor BamB